MAVNSVDSSAAVNAGQVSKKQAEEKVAASEEKRQQLREQAPVQREIHPPEPGRGESVDVTA